MSLFCAIFGIYSFIVNNINLRELNINKYQRKIGIVFQDYVKYETSIRENIAYGNLEQLRNDTEINRLVRKVHLENKVNNNIDTIVGNWFGEQIGRAHV